MKRLLRWAGYGAGGAAALVIVAYLFVHFSSERILRRTYPVPVATIPIPADAASIAEGQRLANVLGCVGGCHGKQAEGTVMFDEPMVGRIVAPNLTAAVRRYGDPELVALIRHGVRPGGRSLMVMPSEAYIALSDQDLGRLIAFLRTLPARDGPGPGISLGPLGRIGVATGQIRPVAVMIAETVPPPEAVGEEATRGRYLARAACAGCHGAGLRGDSNPEFTSPNLQVATAYSREAFTQLMRTGVPIGGRELRTMGPWSRQHLSQFTDAEISALYAYLHALPAAARP